MSKLCSVEGCDGLHVAGGLCGKHYARMKRTGSTDAPPPRPEVCAVEGCNQAVRTAGLCDRHYTRKRRYGATEDGPRAHGSLSDRFWRKVLVLGPRECWPWIGGKDPKGYGKISEGMEGGKILAAHRVAYELTYGVFDKGMPGPTRAVVMHVCDNPACCNPNHLRLATQKDNVIDMVTKNRKNSTTASAHKSWATRRAKLSDRNT